MKELVVISGKGGTGKTSLVACFAALAGEVVLADCDVDAADLHLLLAPETKERMDFYAGKRAFIRQEDCISCGSCLSRCRFEAVKMEGSGAGEARFRIDSISCEGCGLCAYFCPQHAVELVDRKAGEWYLSETRFGPLVHARLAVGEGNSGKLVTQVKNRARGIARERGLEWLIVDGSPGIGCPVIASLAGADLVLIVTEPSLSARHDLERVTELARHFRTPAAGLINRFDINESIGDDIRRWCEDNGIPVMGAVPYDRRFTEAQVRRLSLIECCGGKAAQAVRSAWEAVANHLRRTEGESVRI
jgi:MinD superfamily P-loop ATPase